jgi:serine/threonine-protein kinase RsbW
MEITMVLHLPRDAASVPVSRQVLDGCLQTLGVTPDTRADIALALSEACANVVQHAGPGEDYQVQVSTGSGKCAIEVVNTGRHASNGGGPGTGRWPAEDGESGEIYGKAEVRADGTGDPLSATAEHGRGLKIIDAVVDNLQLTGNDRQGTTVRFEKTLDWLPGAAGLQLFHPGGAS